MEEKRTYDKKKMKGKPISVRFTAGLESAIDRIAEQQGITRATLIRMAILAFVYQHGETP